MGNPKCPICGSTETSLSEEVGADSFFLCAACGVEFSRGMRAGSGEYYERLYGSAGGGYSLSEKWEFREFLADAEKLGIKGKILDVGCGPGYFLKLCASRGFDVYGVDPNEETVAYARQAGLGNVRVGDIDSLENVFPGLKFEVITLFHVLEHLKNPKDSMTGLKNVLASGGYVVVALPNRNRSMLQWKMRKGREGWDYPPHHVTRWDKPALQVFFRSLGLEPIVAVEERILTVKQCFEFLRGVLQLWTSTGLIAKATCFHGAENGKIDSFSRRPMGFFLPILSQIKQAVLFLPIVFLLPFFWLAARIFYFQGTNLYVLGKRPNN